MDEQDFENALATPTTDGRKYVKVDRPEDLPLYKNCLVKLKKAEGYGRWRCLSGGILNHVDPQLRYVYIRSLATNKCFCMQVPTCEFWALPPKEEDAEIRAWQEVLKVVVDRTGT